MEISSRAQCDGVNGNDELEYEDDEVEENDEDSSDEKETPAVKPRQGGVQETYNEFHLVQKRSEN